MRVARSITILAIIATVAMLHINAATLVVGSCLKGRQFTTIQEAVSASAPNGTVLVCPGTYPEQITIGFPLTVKGLTSSSSQGVIIAVPASGLTGDPPSQIVVENTTGVGISDIILDGSGLTSNSSVGISLNTARAIISNSVFRNMNTAVSSSSGTDKSNLIFQNNVIHDVSIGISLRETATAITGNSIVSKSVGIFGGNASSLDPIGNITISDNVFNGGGIMLWDLYDGPTISGNTISNGGISLSFSFGGLITGNRISGTSTGITCEQAGVATVSKNKVARVATAIAVYSYSYDDPVGGAFMSDNIVNEAQCGVYLSGDESLVSGSNIYHNTTSGICR